MNRHVDFEELQDYQEGLLSPEREGEVGLHLEACKSCRDELALLQDLLADLGDLPVEAQPSRDLWPQIQWRMGASKEEGARTVTRTGITLPVWQLAAASITVALISGSAVWAFVSGSGQGPLPAYVAPASVALPAELGSGFEDYETATVELEAILEQGRGVLDPETLQILKENLAVIDEAIEQSRDALKDDPGSGLLRRILAETMRRKMDILQQAAVAINANT
jgi:hypothetical protein